MRLSNNNFEKYYNRQKDSKINFESKIIVIQKDLKFIYLQFKFQKFMNNTDISNRSATGLLVPNDISDANGPARKRNQTVKAITLKRDLFDQKKEIEKDGGADSIKEINNLILEHIDIQETIGESELDKLVLKIKEQQEQLDLAEMKSKRVEAKVEEQVEDAQQELDIKIPTDEPESLFIIRKDREKQQFGHLVDLANGSAWNNSCDFDGQYGSDGAKARILAEERDYSIAYQYKNHDYSGIQILKQPTGKNVYWMKYSKETYYYNDGIQYFWGTNLGLKSKDGMTLFCMKNVGFEGGEDILDVESKRVNAQSYYELVPGQRVKWFENTNIKNYDEEVKKQFETIPRNNVGTIIGFRERGSEDNIQGDMRGHKPFENEESKGEGFYHAELLIEWDKESLIDKEVEKEIKRIIDEEDGDVDLENKDKITFALFKKIIQDKMPDPEKYPEEVILEAFVSMGGQEQGEGVIEPQQLIEAILKEFDVLQDFEKPEEDSERLYKIPYYDIFFANVAYSLQDDIQHKLELAITKMLQEIEKKKKEKEGFVMYDNYKEVDFITAAKMIYNDEITHAAYSYKKNSYDNSGKVQRYFPAKYDSEMKDFENYGKWVHNTSDDDQYLFMWAHEEIIQSNNKKPKRKEDNQALKNENHFKLMETLRSHDLHHKNLVKTLFLYQWNDYHDSHPKKPYMIYSKYIDNLVETYESIRIQSADTDRETSKILIKQGQQTTSMMLLALFQQSNQKYKPNQGPQWQCNKLDQMQLEKWFEFFMKDDLRQHTYDYQDDIFKYITNLKGQLPNVTDESYYQVVFPMFNQLEQATLQIPVVIYQNDDGYMYGQAVPKFLAVYDIQRQIIISELVPIHVSERLRWRTNICQSSDVTYADHKDIKKSLKTSISGIFSDQNQNDDTDLHHTVKYQLLFDDMSVNSIEIQEFKITCRLKNEGSNSNQKIRAEVSLLGLKYAQMKSQFCQIKDNPYAQGFSDQEQYHVLVPKFNQQLEIIGTQLGFTNCHRKHINDNRIQFLDFPGLDKLDRKQMYLMVDTEINEDPVKEPKFRHPHDQNSKMQEDFDDDQQDKKLQENWRALKVEEIIYDEQNKEIEKSKEQEKRQQGKQNDKQSGEEVQKQVLTRPVKIRNLKDKQKMMYARHSSSYYMNTSSVRDVQDQSTLTQLHRPTEIDAISAAVELSKRDEKKFTNIEKQQQMNTALFTILNMTPNNAMLEQDDYADEKWKKFLEDDMFTPLECFQGQCPAICQIKYPSQLKKCIEHEQDCKFESKYHPSLIQELVMSYNPATQMYEYKKRLIDDNYNDQYYQELAKFNDPSNKEEKPEYKEGVEFMGKLKSAGRMRNVQEITYDFDRSSILKFTLEKSKLFQTSIDLLFSKIFSSKYMERQQRMIVDCIDNVKNAEQDEISMKKQFYEQLMITKYIEDPNHEGQHIIDENVIQFGSYLRHKRLENFSKHKITKVSFNYEGNMNSQAEYMDECANQFLQQVQKNETRGFFDWFFNAFKEDNDKGYEVVYGLIDLRGQLQHNTQRDEMWLSEIVSDAMTTHGTKIDEMNLIMKIIDSQFQTTQTIAKPLIIVYVLFDLIPLVAQMMVTDATSFYFLTSLFSFTNIFPFGLIEFIQIKNRKKTGYFQDPWNALDSLNILFQIAYGVTSYSHMHDIIKMNRVYQEDTTPENFAVIRENFSQWFWVVVMRFILLTLGFFQVLNQLRTFESFGKLVMLVLKTVSDTTFFLIFLILWVVFFGVLFIVLRIEFDDEDYPSTIGMHSIILIQTYRNFIGDLAPPDVSQWLDVDDKTTSGPFPAIVVALVWLSWLLITYIGLIIILNFLIALISQSYEEVMTQQLMYLYKNKADQNKVFIYLSDTFKKMFSRGKNNSNLNFNTIVIAFEQSSEINEDDWQGFITTIKSIIKKQNDRTSKKLFKDIQTDIQKVSDEIKENFGQKMGKMEEDTSELKESVKQIITDQKLMKDALDKFIASNEEKKEEKGDGQKEEDAKSKKEYDYTKIDQATEEIKVLSQQIHKMMNKSKSDKSEVRNQPLAGLMGNYFSRASATFKNDNIQPAILETEAKDEEDEVFETIQVEEKARAYSSVPMNLKKSVKKPEGDDEAKK